MNPASRTLSLVRFGLILIWTVGVVAVWTWTTRYEFTTHADEDLTTGRRWPDDSRLALAVDRPTLLFFLHPYCPCSRASLGELERLVAGGRLAPEHRPSTRIVVSLPAEADRSWRESDTVRRAAALPDAELVWDVDGQESRRFGAVTSGSVRLFEPSGELRFAGGITPSRGHEGSNSGSTQLAELLGPEGDRTWGSSPVFGCRLCVDRACGADVVRCEASGESRPAPTSLAAGDER